MTFRQHNGIPSSPAAVVVADGNVLARTVMIVYLRIAAWSGLRQDKAANAAVGAAHGSKANATRVSKHLIPVEALAPVLKAAGAIRAAHYRYTLPWMDDGARVLSAGAFFDYQREIGRLVDEYREAADDLAAAYPSHVANAKAQLGGLFNIREYPQDIRKKFDVDTTFLPFPTGEDFRVDGINGAEEEIKAKLNNLPAMVEAKAREEIGARVLDVARKMVERMGAYTGGKAGSFRDSLVDNVRELVEVLPALNVTGDAMVEEITRELARLGSVDVDSLRESQVLRDETKAAAEAIVAKMEGYL